MRLSLLALLVGAVLLSSCDSGSRTGDIEDALLDVSTEVLASGFSIPWGIDVIGEEEYLFSERLGSLYHYQDSEAVVLEGIPNTHTVTVAGLTYGGLMDVSLHPQFDANGWVYITYVNTAGRMVVARFSFAERTVQDFEVLFTSNAFSIGSRIAWQDDAHLFVTQGLGGNPTPEPGAQNLANDGGKIHRLMADGSIPPDNPVFEGRSAPSSVWSFGHRDPQGLFFDADEGVLYSNEHGPLGGDEFNVIQKGGNYGWPLFSYGLNYDETPVSTMSEQDARRTTVLPLQHWDEDFNLAPSGLERLRGSLFPELEGAFLMGALAQQGLVAYNTSTRQTFILLRRAGRVRDVAQLPSGRVLLLIDKGSPNRSDSGRIVRLTPRSEPVE